MATLTVTTTSRSGTNLETADTAAAGGGDKFTNDGLTLLYVNNADAGSVTITFPVVTTVDGLAVASRTVVVTGTTHMLIGPFPMTVYNDTNGFLNFTYSAVTTLFVAPIKPGT